MKKAKGKRIGKDGRSFIPSPETLENDEVLRQGGFRFRYELDRETRDLWYVKLPKRPRRERYPPLQTMYVAAQSLARGFGCSTPRDKPVERDWAKPFIPRLGKPYYDEKRGELVMPMTVQFSGQYREFFLPDHKGLKCPRGETTPFTLLGKVRVKVLLNTPGLVTEIHTRRPLTLLDVPITYGMCDSYKTFPAEARATGLKVWNGARGCYEVIEFRKLPVCFVSLTAEMGIDVHEHYEVLSSSIGSAFEELTFRNPKAKPYKPNWKKK